MKQGQICKTHMRGKMFGKEGEQSTLTNAFSDRQIWSYDLFRVDQKYVTNVEMVCWDINTTQLFISIFPLQNANHHIFIWKSVQKSIVVLPHP